MEGRINSTSGAVRNCRLSRRAVLAAPLTVSGTVLRARGFPSTDGDTQVVDVSVKSEGSTSPGFERQDFGTVGIFDVDWLVQPEFTHLLDNLAASPGAFHGV